VGEVAAGGRGRRRIPPAQRRDDAASQLDRLERLRSEYGGDAAQQKLALLRGLERRALGAAQVLRLHEVLCFLRAYPDDARVLEQVERMLAGFDRRRDLRRHRAALANSGIAGTEIRFRFFAPMARWLARRWPSRLTITWNEFENRGLLERLLPLIAHFAGSPALDEYALTVRQWIRTLGSRSGTDAAFLIRAFERLRMDAFAREILYDELDVPIILKPALGTPSRTRARLAPSRVAFQRRPLSRSRPDLSAELRRPPLSIRAVSPRQAQSLIDLAREAMVTRKRDLDVFAYGDPRDVRLVDCGDGLEFACIGAIPERRLLLESVYGYLTLKNAVPIGYVLTASLYRSAEIAYNVFETYRGTEAGLVYGRLLAMTRSMFGADTFMIPPYQLGEGNDEALDSGAWWFYRKLGYAPRDPAAIQIMRGEERAMRSDPAHRSSRATLAKLARANLFFHHGPRRDDALGVMPLPNVGLHALRYVAERFGGDRERATEVCSREAARMLGVAQARLTPGERLAFQRWSPLVMILPGIGRWSLAERRAAAAVIPAKGGRRESDFVLAFDRHRKLRRALVTLAGRAPQT
jgi:hypothetical protein